MRYSDIRQIFKDCDLCFGNIAYCCGLKKPCPNRDECMRRLGLTRQQYSEWKRLLIYNLLDYIEAKVVSGSQH